MQLFVYEAADKVDLPVPLWGDFLPRLLRTLGIFLTCAPFRYQDT
jgi:hypothetical protein